MSSKLTRSTCALSAGLLLTACASTMPQPRACSWQLPMEKLQSCPASLPLLKEEALLGDLLSTAVAAAGQYHACRLVHDELIAAVKVHAAVCNSTKE